MAKLQDLYKRGAAESVTDAEGNIAKFWMKKLNPVESRTALTKSNAARARYLLAKRDEESDEYLSIWSDLSDMTDEEVAEIAISGEVMEKIPAIEAELRANPKWADEDFLESLEESWDSTYKKIWLMTRPDEETGEVPSNDFDEDEIKNAEKTYDKLVEFQEENSKKIDNVRKAALRRVNNLSDEEVKKKALEAIFERTANAAWMEEYYKWQIYFAIMDPEDHNSRYFSSIEEVAELETAVYAQVVAKYRGFEVDQLDAKK